MLRVKQYINSFCTTLLFRLMAILLSFTLSGCVTVTEEPAIIVNGAASYLENYNLPQGSVITIAIIDFDTPGSILAQKTFETVTVPVTFKFFLPAETIDEEANYGVVGLIKYNEQVLFQTYDRFPVINNGKLATEVIMKPQR